MTDIFDYFRELQNLIQNLPDVEIEKYEEQILTGERGNLRCRLRFSDNSLLEVSEAIQIIKKNPRWLSYRYHYQDSTGNLIFRCDNVPHYPKIKTHLVHKHLFDKVIDSLHPAFESILNEIKRHVSK